jgi:universal stress protein E
VWIVGAGQVSRQPRIVADVDADAAEPVTQSLNVKSIEMALLLASLEKGSVTVLHAWRPYAERKLSVHASEAESDASVVDARNRAADALALLTDSFGPRLSRVELRRGLPEDVIPAFAVAEGIDIVVTGTKGETGIWRRLFGSTAERLLEATPCSLVVVKPGE